MTQSITGLNAEIKTAESDVADAQTLLASANRDLLTKPRAQALAGIAAAQKALDEATAWLASLRQARSELVAVLRRPERHAQRAQCHLETTQHAKRARARVSAASKLDEAMAAFSSALHEYIAESNSLADAVIDTCKRGVLDPDYRHARVPLVVSHARAAHHLAQPIAHWLLSWPAELRDKVCHVHGGHFVNHRPYPVAEAAARAAEDLAWHLDETVQVSIRAEEDAISGEGGPRRMVDGRNGALAKSVSAHAEGEQ
jgi:hypothetical protein